MWKSIVLCVSLFGGAAIGLTLGARFVEPAALPAAAAIGLCVIGVVLILAAPTDARGETSTATTQATSGAVTSAEPAVTPLKIPAVTPVAAAVAGNHTPAMPIEALNS